MANKWVYMFSEGDMTMRNLLGEVTVADIFKTKNYVTGCVGKWGKIGRAHV